MRGTPAEAVVVKGRIWGEPTMTGSDIEPIAVVIMSVDSDPRTREAVESILGQDIKSQVVVVNTGKGSLVELLGPSLERITLVEADRRRLPGGTRNLGLIHSSAPLVAFLAADCLATPAWLRRRLDEHASGRATVASALRPAPDGSGRISATAWAMHALIHFERMPEVPERLASRFGLSYERSLFDRFGRFDETLVVSEDQEFNRICTAGAEPGWNPDIVTLHRYPQSLGAALRDSFVRGRRASQWAKQARRRFALLRYSGWRLLLIVKRSFEPWCPARFRSVSVLARLPLLYLAWLCGALSAGSRT